MENPETLKRSKIVEDGTIILNVPKLDDGTRVEVVISPTEPNDQVSSNQSQTAEKMHPTTNQDNTTSKEQESGNFDSLGLIEPLVEGVLDQGYKIPTAIQQQAIPQILAGKDLLGSAQTGSGKTAAFVLPMLQLLLEHQKKGKRNPRALIMSPTRELAKQIADSIKNYGRYVELYHVVIYGGVSQKPQVKKLRRGCDIVVGTPGRLIDLMNQGHLVLDKLDLFILDEADRMLDMGFLPDIKRVLREIPTKRQTLMFSATIPKPIAQLAKEIQHQPVRITVDPPSSTVDTIDSYLYHVDKKNKFDLLLSLFETKPEMRKVLIFRRTKYSCDKLVKKLKKKGYYAGRIHGNRSQNQREKVLEKFRNDDIDILVATDVVARGLDIDDITHVINYEITNEPEVYVHRVGRTARAGKDGIALNFCSKSEQKYIRDIEKLTQELMIRVNNHPYQSKKKKMKVTHLSSKTSDNNQSQHQAKKNNHSKRKTKKYYRKQ